MNGGGYYFLRKAHYILIRNRSALTACGQFNLFSSGEVHQKALGYGLRKPVACSRDHSVGHHTAVSGDTYIGSAGAHIQKGYIQHAEIKGNGHLNGCDGLQCQVNNRESCHIHSLIQSVHHVIRQKGGDDLGTYAAAFMVFKC